MKNSLIEGFLEKARKRLAEDSSSMSNSEWVCKHTRLRGKPFSLTGYEFQRAILDDQHPNMSVIKCSQVGLTEINFRKILAFVTRNRGVTAIFTLPTEDMFKRTSNSRIKPLVGNEPIFNPPSHGFNKPTRSVGHFEIGESHLFVTNVDEGAATSTPADAVFNDEVDLSYQAMLSLFFSRLQNSEWKINQKFSTPTFINYGIDSDFVTSDQHYYLVRCLKCGHWNDPKVDLDHIIIPGMPSVLSDFSEIDATMVDDMELEEGYVCCKKCRSKLDLADPSLRSWVPRFPSRSHSRGYCVRPFSTSRIGIPWIVNRLLDYKKRDFVRGFYNTVAGEAYNDGNVRLSEPAIQACFEASSDIPAKSKEDQFWIGIDVGRTCHIIIGKNNGGQWRTYRFYTVRNTDLREEVKKLMETWNIVGGCIDRNPEAVFAGDVMRISGGKIVPVEYTGQREVNLMANELKELTHAQINRTIAIDHVAELIRDQNVAFAGFGVYRSIIVEHLRDMYREDDPDRPAVWKKLMGNDHYMHCLTYLTIAPRIREAITFREDEDRRSLVLASGILINMGDSPLFGRRNIEGELVR